MMGKERFLRMWECLNCRCTVYESSPGNYSWSASPITGGNMEVGDADSPEAAIEAAEDASFRVFASTRRR